MRNQNKFRVTLNHPHDRDSVSLKIYMTEVGGRVLRAKPVQLVFEPVVEGEYAPPTLDVPDSGLFRALAEALHNYGIRCDPDAVLVGELAAKNEHLSDLRKLVFDKEHRRSR